MNTAILYHDKEYNEDDQEDYEALVNPMIASWLPIFRRKELTNAFCMETLEALKNAAFMAWLAANCNIPVKKHIIDAFREIFLATRNTFLEKNLHNPAFAEIMAKYEKHNMRLAKALTVLDIANDPGIAEVFADARR